MSMRRTYIPRVDSGISTVSAHNAVTTFGYTGVKDIYALLRIKAADSIEKGNMDVLLYAGVHGQTLRVYFVPCLIRP